MLTRRRLIASATVIAVAGFGQHGGAQTARTVRLTYRPPVAPTLREPVVVELSLHNHLDEPVILSLGKNNIGNLQLALRKPDGESITSDPRQPKSAEEGYTNTPIVLQPQEQRTEHVLLDEWFGSLDAVGQYHLTVTFIGTARTVSGKDIDVVRVGSVSLQVSPFDPVVLRSTCERLARIARSTMDAREARFAAKVLTYVRDRIAVEYLESLIERGKALEIYAVEVSAVNALEAMGTDEAHNALARARYNSREVTAEKVNEALLRMDLKRLRK